MQVMKFRRPKVFSPFVRNAASNAKAVDSDPVVYFSKSGTVSVKEITDAQSQEKNKTQALEQCRHQNTFEKLSHRYWTGRYEAEWRCQEWHKPESHIVCQQASNIGRDCELCYWAKVFEGTIRRERHQRLQLHEKLLNHIAYPHGPCDICGDPDYGLSVQSGGVEFGDRTAVRDTVALAKSQLQDIHEMKMVAGMMQWLWEAEVKGLG